MWWGWGTRKVACWRVSISFLGYGLDFLSFILTRLEVLIEISRYIYTLTRAHISSQKSTIEPSAPALKSQGCVGWNVQSNTPSQSWGECARRILRGTMSAFSFRSAWTFPYRTCTVASSDAVANSGYFLWNATLCEKHKTGKKPEKYIGNQHKIAP